MKTAQIPTTIPSTWTLNADGVYDHITHTATVTYGSSERRKRRWPRSIFCSPRTPRKWRL